jgi:hypothetical protein
MMRFIVTVAALLFTSTSAANAAWHVATSKHFIVYADDKPERLTEYTNKLERFDKAFRLFRQFPDGDVRQERKVTIFLAESVQDIQKLAGRDGVAGFYNPRAGAPVAFVPREAKRQFATSLTSQEVFFHEYTHHLMLTTWTDVALPGWLIEGFAEFHATAIMKDDGSVIFGAPPVYRNYTIARKELMPVEKLLNPGPKKLSDIETDAFYGRGWLLTHYLTFDGERRKWLATYIGQLNTQKPGDTTVLDGIANLEAKLESYLRKPSFPSGLITTAQLSVGKVDVRALTAAEATIMPVQMRSAAGVNKKTALEVVALARKISVSFPNDAAVQNALAEAECDAKDYARAQAAADAAIAAAPTSVHALLYKGYALQGAAVKGESKDPAVWKAIRRAYLAANKANPEDPRPLIAYFDSFAANKEEPTANADSGLLYALALAPFDREYQLREKAAKIALLQGNKDSARIILGPVAYSAEEREQSEFALKIIGFIDANDIPGALAEYQKGKDEAERKAKEAKTKEKSRLAT